MNRPHCTAILHRIYQAATPSARRFISAKGLRGSDIRKLFRRASKNQTNTPRRVANLSYHLTENKAHTLPKAQRRALKNRGRGLA